ncbi:MAG: ABC transporter permease [Dehalococcoidia bacterium]|nr:ABC transporter permease [Dehalococcoidia bacterium]
MNTAREFRHLVVMHFQMYRADLVMIGVINIAMTLGLVLGIGYIVPDISKVTATYITTGTATQTLVNVGLVLLPQGLSEAKRAGRLDYFLALPISREAYLLAQVTTVAVVAIPSIAFSVGIGWWHYGLSLHADPLVAVAAVLAVLSLAGVGVAIAMLSPHPQVTNAFSQLIIFYVLFFAPVLVPSEQLPWLLQKTAVVMPPTYAADAVRATLTGLPGTHLARSLMVMSGFAAGSLVLSAVMIRRRA